jgi:hypothetical protein
MEEQASKLETLENANKKLKLKIESLKENNKVMQQQVQEIATNTKEIRGIKSVFDYRCFKFITHQNKIIVVLFFSFFTRESFQFGATQGV